MEGFVGMPFSKYFWSAKRAGRSEQAVYNLAQTAR